MEHFCTAWVHDRLNSSALNSMLSFCPVEGGTESHDDGGEFMLRIGVDIGGTFTDFAAWRDGENCATELTTFKIPSTPPHYAKGFKEGFKEVLARVDFKPGEEIVVVHGTTISTNTVIERSGANVALMTTAGFRDILELKRLKLSRRIDMMATRTPPLVPRQHVFGIDERLLADGTVRQPIDLDDVVQAAGAAVSAGAQCIAVAFLHSFRNPAHELAACAAIQDVVPEVDVTMSSEIWPRIGEYERATVSVLNAYVKPRMDAYMAEIEAYLAEKLPSARLFITRSNGGAMAASEARRYPVQTLLSGPASGVTAACFLGQSFAGEKLLSMDMGGTSTDLSLIVDGRPTISNAAEVGDFPLMMPVTGIEAIGAGGGSIARMDGPLLRIGPQSAGADPGPACFGKGGSQPTLSDAYLLAGYIDPANFLGGRLSLDVGAAEEAMQGVASALRLDLAAASDACVTVATSNMVARVLPYLARYGVDPEDLTLVVCGGAGALHGPLLAAEIGIGQVLVPTVPSVFCAFGGLVSEIVNDTAVSVQGTLVSSESLTEDFIRLEAEARSWLSAQISEDLLTGVRIEHWAEMRYRGQSFELNVHLPESAVRQGDMDSLAGVFHAEHERLYAHADPKADVEYVDLRVRVHGALTTPERVSAEATQTPIDSAQKGQRSLRFGGKIFDDAPIYDRAHLGPGHRIAGPAIIDQDDTTILIPPGFVADVQSSLDIIMQREA
jgi:N-methylhydantoinase A